MENKSMSWVCPLCKATYNRKGKCKRWVHRGPHYRQCEARLISQEEYDARLEL